MSRHVAVRFLAPELPRGDDGAVNRLPIVRTACAIALFRVVRRVLPRRRRWYPTRAGRLYLDISESAPMLMRVLRVYEPDTHAVLAEVLQPGMTFVDVGACVGDYSLLAAGRVGPHGRVVAIEPEPGNAAWLRRSVARRRLHNVSMHELALSDAQSQAILHRHERFSGWHSLLETAANTGGDVAVQTQTLDGLLAGLGIATVDAIKIDAEGSELAILRGAAATLGSGPSSPAILMDLHPSLGVDPLAVAAILRGHGYETFRPDVPLAPLEVRADTEVLLARPRASATPGSRERRRAT